MQDGTGAGIRDVPSDDLGALFESSSAAHTVARHITDPVNSNGEDAAISDLAADLTKAWIPTRHLTGNGSITTWRPRNAVIIQAAKDLDAGRISFP